MAFTPSPLDNSTDQQEEHISSPVSYSRRYKDYIIERGVYQQKREIFCLTISGDLPWESQKSVNPFSRISEKK